MSKFKGGKLIDLEEGVLRSRILPVHNRKANYLLINVLPWIFVFILILAYRHLYSFDNSLVTGTGLTVIDLVALLLCSILITRFIIPQLLYKRRLIFFALALTALMVLYVLVVMSAQAEWYRIRGVYDAVAVVFNSLPYQVFNSWIVVFLGCLGIILFRVLVDHYAFQKSYEELKREKAETELSFLKAQINPHFLFNSINSVYGSIDKSNNTARNTLLRFSEMLRYQLYECGSDSIDIGRELSYLRNYVELQRLRREENLEVQLDMATFPSGFRIAPLLFIPFLENAFKYVSNFESKPNYIRIELRHEENGLVFQVRNSKDKEQHQELMTAGGIGIENVKRRLILLYPSAHSLIINNGPEEFSVQLKLELK